MKHFKQIFNPRIDGVLTALRGEIISNEKLWPAEQGRQRKIQVQRETQSIPLRAVCRRRGDVRKNEEIHESQMTPYATFFPSTMSFLNDIAIVLGGSLERALYVKLLPRSVVYPHIDEGAYYSVRDRYHFVVNSSFGSSLTSGGEQVIMQAGELWWFDNKAIHESANLSDECRIHLIFDIF